MPRLLPIDWIRIVATNYLLQLYEKEYGFMKEWETVKAPFVQMIALMGRTSSLIWVEHLLMRNPPDDFISWVSDLQKLRNYLNSFQTSTDLSDLREISTHLEIELAPYKLLLNELGYKWNLRAPWAGEELMGRDVHRILQDIFNAAGVTAFNDFSDRQIQTLVGDKSPLSADNGPIYPSILSLYLSGGRTGYLDKLNRRFKEFEEKMKASGAKEPPSALGKHAEWWFDHYVHDIKFPDIANKIAEIDERGGPQTENIGKAVIKFSEFLGIDPIEPT